MKLEPDRETEPPENEIICPVDGQRVRWSTWPPKCPWHPEPQTWWGDKPPEKGGAISFNKSPEEGGGKPPEEEDETVQYMVCYKDEDGDIRGKPQVITASSEEEAVAQFKEVEGDKGFAVDLHPLTTPRA